MRRFVAVLASGIMLAAALVVSGGGAGAQAVGACGFSQEQYVETTATHLDSALGWIVLHESVQTENDGCGSKEYVVYQYFTRQGSSTQVYPAGYYVSFVRVWVCGAYQGTWQGHANTPWIVVSPTFFYGTCGRQADNQSSFFHDNSYNQNWSAYRNQG